MSAGDHLDDVLSAYLDDQLAADERVDVEAHLQGCAECRSDLEAERDVRQLLRDLPAVDPPFGFYERLRRDGPEAEPAPAKRRRFRFGLANIAATAAAWILILGVANLHSNGSVDPSPQGYVSTASVIPTFSKDKTQSQEAARSHDVPDELAGTYQLVGYTEDNGILRFVYKNDEQTLSVFLVRGDLDRNALPAGATAYMVNGVPAWSVQTSEGDVLYVEQPGMVVVIVGQPLDAAASEVAGSNGPRQGGESLGDRITGAASGLLDTFGLRG